MKIVARPWQPQDLIDDLQSIIDEESDNYLNDRRTTLCIARDYLKEHFAEQKWVPASEPPKERGCYLISVKHWLDGKPVTREAFWNGADWLSCYWKKGDRVELTPRVTHWQYLPQPPKGE